MRRFRYIVLGLGAVGVLATGFLSIDEFPRGAHSTTPSLPDSATEPPEVVIGEWEDSVGSWKQRILIVEYAGLIMREVHVPDGRIDRDILREVAPQGSEGRRFENPSSQFGQAYAITRYGQLAIHDDDGFIGQAINIAPKGDQR